MFYCILLSQFVCIHKLGKNSEIESLTARKKFGIRNSKAYEVLAEEEVWALANIVIR